MYFLLETQALIGLLNVIGIQDMLSNINSEECKNRRTFQFLNSMEKLKKHILIHLERLK